MLGTSRPLDAIDMRRPLMDQPTWNADNRPHVPLTPANEQQRRSRRPRTNRWLLPSYKSALISLRRANRRKVLPIARVISNRCGLDWR
jgi:hypothetical protein